MNDTATQAGIVTHWRERAEKAEALLAKTQEAILEAIGLAQQDHAPYAMRKACTDRWRSLHDAIVTSPLRG